MNMKRREVEVKGTDIEKAVSEGLKKLGLDRTEVIVEIVDEGSRGLLGLGSREAVVRIKEINPTGIADEIQEAPLERVETAVSKPAKSIPQDSEKKQVEPQRPDEQTKNINTQSKNGDTEPAGSDFSESENDLLLLEKEKELAVDLLSTLLQKMNINADISAALSEPDNLTGKRMNVLNVKGDNLGELIGSRGETLSSLQYITRLIVGHQLRQRSNFVIDIEGYRQRREQALSRLAERMAEKVIKRGRPIALEPMPPHERRIIHMTLRNNATVETHSVGEGSRRKVRVVPKNLSK